MKVFAVVFATESVGLKRRLSAGFNPEERRLLSSAMLEDVLTALKSSIIHEVVVVGSDSNIVEVADKFGVSFISQGQTVLASAVRKAIEWCVEKKADVVLILPVNIPMVSSRDIDGIVELGSKESSVVLSPALNGGMNALFLNPPDVIQACFGPGCFFKNVEAAIKKDVAVKFYSSRELAMDMGSEEDLQRLLETENGIMSKQVFQQIRLQKSNKS